MSHERTGGDHYDPAELPAGFTVQTCIVVTCRTCQRAYGDEDDSVTIHFPDPDDAACTVAEAGWWVTQHGAQCGPCAAVEACQTLGHAWPAWTRCGCGGRIPDHVWQMEYRTCASCGEQDERIAPTSTDEHATGLDTGEQA